MVCRGNDSSQDDGRVNHADPDNGEPSPAEPATLPQGYGGDGEADEEGVSKMKRRHGS